MKPFGKTVAKIDWQIELKRRNPRQPHQWDDGGCAWSEAWRA
jgi:hypothetical protein